MELTDKDFKDIEIAIAAGFPRLVGIALGVHSTYPSVMLEMSPDVMVAVSPTAHMHMDRRDLEGVQFPISVGMRLEPGQSPYEISYLQKIVARLVICDVLKLTNLTEQPLEDKKFKVFLDSTSLNHALKADEAPDGKDQYTIYGFIGLFADPAIRDQLITHAKFQAAIYVQADEAMAEQNDKPNNAAMAIMAGKLH